MAIRLQRDTLKRYQEQKGWSNSELARRSGVDRTYLWRLMLPYNDPRNETPGPKTIERLLKAFPELTFDELFFLDTMLADSNRIDDQSKHKEVSPIE